jgi:general nucleoside transport system ATP-binding protein
MHPLLELHGITKRFPGVLANDRIDFALGAGEVLGLLGENGAGKSTLMNIVSGLLAPDEGDIRIAGTAVSFASPREAIAAGIGMVHQHFMLVPTLTVVENVVLGDRRLSRARPDLRRAAQRIAALGRTIGLAVDPEARVGELDVGGQQRVEIIKALWREARILILDEPTAVLSRADSAGLFAMIRRLAGSGVGVILISHKLDDVFAVCDRVVVMRQGRVVDEAPIAERTARELVRRMVGEEVAAPVRAASAAVPGPALLEVSGLAVARESGAPALEHVSFQLHGGEILALAGIEGNGQSELVEALCGLRPPTAGRIRFLGAAAGGVRSLRRGGLRHVPDDRHESGILPGLSLTENFLLDHFFAPTYSHLGCLDRGAAARRVMELIEAFDIRATGPAADVATLSGGNQQKFVLARELSGEVRVLIAAQPTRGLDVRTIAFIGNELLRRRAEGLGILLVSSELSEIWEIADRVMVAAAGRIVGPVPVAETSVQQLGAWMAGG